MPPARINTPAQLTKADGDVVEFTLQQLKAFPQRSVTTTLQCAGNRRREMSEVRHVNGLSWGNAAISTAKWTGASLRDVLTSLGTEPSRDAVHVEFIGLDCDVTGAPCSSRAVKPGHARRIQWMHLSCAAMQTAGSSVRAA